MALGEERQFQCTKVFSLFPEYKQVLSRNSDDLHVRNVYINKILCLRDTSTYINITLLFSLRSNWLSGTVCYICLLKQETTHAINAATGTLDIHKEHQLLRTTTLNRNSDDNAETQRNQV